MESPKLIIPLSKDEVLREQNMMCSLCIPSFQSLSRTPTKKETFELKDSQRIFNRGNSEGQSLGEVHLRLMEREDVDLQASSVNSTEPSMRACKCLEPKHKKCIMRQITEFHIFRCEMCKAKYRLKGGARRKWSKLNSMFMLFCLLVAAVWMCLGMWVIMLGLNIPSTSNYYPWGIFLPILTLISMLLMGYYTFIYIYNLWLNRPFTQIHLLSREGNDEGKGKGMSMTEINNYIMSNWEIEYMELDEMPFVRAWYAEREGKNLEMQLENYIQKYGGRDRGSDIRSGSSSFSRGRGEGSEELNSYVDINSPHSQQRAIINLFDIEGEQHETEESIDSQSDSGDPSHEESKISENNLHIQNGSEDSCEMAFLADIDYHFYPK